MLLVGCGRVGECLLELKLPDNEARNLVRQIEIWVVNAEAGQCADFISGQLVPGKGAARILAQLLLDFPAQASGKSLQDVPVGWALFLAEGRGADGRKFLRGCRAAEVKSTSALKLEIALEWICKPVDEVCFDGLDNDCDGETDEGCIECQNDADCQDQNSCTIDFCSEQSCHHSPFPDNTWCDDGDACTISDGCQKGVCTGTLRDCSALDDQCNIGVCQQGECRTAPRPQNTGCDDGLFCSDPDSCNDGLCSGPPRACDDGDSCTEDICDEASRSCRHELRPRPGAEGPAGDATCSDKVDNDCDGLTDAQDANCLFCTSDAECDDANPCTRDLCQGMICSNEPLAEENSCEDGLFCTVDDRCLGGTCQGQARDCSAGAGPCQYGVCSEQNRRCELRQSGDGTPCNDGLFCTLGDRCLSGSCTGTTRDCDDGNPCTADTCDEALRACKNTMVPVPGAEGLQVGDSCSNGLDDDCDGLADRADPDCIQCTQDSQCNDSNPCTEDRCQNGLCSNQNLSDGSICDDGLYCTVDDACSAGICTGQARDCSPLADQCNSAICDENQDACCRLPRADGTLCDDGLFCTVGDSCQGGQCRASPRDCDDHDSCTADSCSESEQKCLHQLVPNPGAEGPPGHGSCQSGLDEDCDGLTDLDDPDCYECQQDTECNDGNPCTQDRCQIGVCTHQNLSNGTPCNDGQYCTTPDTCQNGSCGGPPRDCSAWASACRQGVCDEQNDQCRSVNLPDNTGCDDGLYCTVNDSCAAGSCTGASRDCSSLADQCNNGVCDEQNDTCKKQPLAGTPSCNDGLFCTDPDTCQNGVCTGPARNCSDGDVCTTDSCSESEQKCLHQLTYQGSEGPAGAPNCSDGQDNDCDGQTDLADGDCVNCYGPADCDDANPCTSDLCSSGVCQNPNLSNGTDCNDGLYCTVGDSCQNGLCQGSARDCSALSDACHQGVCNEQLDQCQATVKPDDTPCDDGRFCTISDACQSGVCQGAPRVCDDGDFCTDDSCSSATDQCQYLPAPRPEAQDWCANSVDEDCDGRTDGCCLANGSYTLSSTTSVGSDPWYMTGADLNYDGRIDLMTANRAGNSVSVLINSGDGTFQASSYTTAANTYGLAAADLDRDGRMDIVAACNSGNALTILWGQAGGGFCQRQDLAISANPAQVIAADFNLDGIPDLASANWANSTVGVWLGQGGRTFSGPVTYSVGASGVNTRALVAGDFNADGIPDIAAANWGGGKVSIMLGQGDGSFPSAVRYDAGSTEVNIVTADFNEDGILDLAVTAMNDNAINILLGNGSGGRGDGTFASRVAYTTGATPVSAFPADLNGDGILDLLVAEWGTGGMSVMYGNGASGRGNGTFGQRQFFASATQPTAAVALEADGDNILDLASSNYGPDNVTVLRGRGSGSRPDASFYFFASLATGSQAKALLASDFNGDNILDLVLGAGANPKLRFYTGGGGGGRGNATFTSSWSSNAGQDVSAQDSGDVNGDRIADVVTTDTVQKKLRFYFQNGSSAQGNGTFVEGPNYNTSGSLRRVKLADVNRDGILDLIWNEQPGGLGLRLGLGSAGVPSGTFGSATLVAAGSTPEGLAVGDLNRDGLSDAVVTDSSGNAVKVFLGQSSGSFTLSGSLGAGTMPVEVVLFDLNNDGALDLAVANKNSHNLSVYLGQGDGSFGAEVRYATGNSPVAVIAARLNDDQHADLVTANASGTLSVLLGSGGGAFGSASSISVGGTPAALALGNFDWDGKLDAAVVDPSANQIIILRGGGVCTAP